MTSYGANTDIPTTRIRTAKGKWIELPADILGMVWARYRSGKIALASAAEMQAGCQARMAEFDSLPPVKRWEANYCRVNGNLKGSHYSDFHRGGPSWTPDKTTPPQWGAKVSPLSAEDLGL